MNRTICALMLAALLALPSPCLAASARETLQNAMDEILEVLKTPSQKGTPGYDKERSELKTIIEKIFDFNELSARAVGLHWKRFSPEQKKRFVQAFSGLLGAKYLDRIQAYKNERIVLGEMRSSKRGNVEIQSQVVQGEKTIPIAYRMTETSDGWRIYDVIVEGVSLVKNYRSQFMEIMVNGSPDTLIQAVRDKANSIKSGSSSSLAPTRPDILLQGGNASCSLAYVTL